MISLVIPVCWGYKPFADFLSSIVELPVIGEVILINNNKNITPDHHILSHHKVNHYVMEDNIFVNPAWNLGAKLAKHDIICIMNDDIAVDLRAFIEADKFVTKEVGLLSAGISYESYLLMLNKSDEIENLQKLLTSGDIKIKEFGPETDLCASGTLFFVHKDNWVDIPECFKIYWGDTWQLDAQKLLGRNNYFMNDLFFYTPWHVSSKIGVAGEYQQSKEYWDNENETNFRKHQVKFVLENNIPVPEHLTQFLEDYNESNSLV